MRVGGVFTRVRDATRSCARTSGMSSQTEMFVRTELHEQTHEGRAPRPPTNVEYHVVLFRLAPAFEKREEEVPRLPVCNSLARA